MRLSVTLLDTFNSYNNGNIPESQLIDSITHEFVGNFYTERGSAFHKAIENGTDTEGDFKFKGIEKVMKEVENYRQHGLAELKSSKRYYINGEIVELVGKADYWTPKSICELKSTTRFNQYTYLNSIQWKCYMDIFNVPEVVYVVATIDVYENIITEVNTLTMLYYDEINVEITDLLALFIKYLNKRGLYEYIPSSY
jgi:hypothetical protein